MLAVVVEEEGISPGEQLLIIGCAIGRKGPAHQHHGAIADEAGDSFIRQRLAPKLRQGSVDTVAQVLRGVDQRAVEIENQQFQRSDGKRAKNMKHEFSVKGTESPFTIPWGECDDGAVAGARRAAIVTLSKGAFW